MTIQDLSTKKNEIIAYATEKGVDVKKFMQTLVDFVEFGLNETEDVEKFYQDVYWNTFHKSNKHSNLRETMGAINEKTGFETRKYFANKNGYRN